MINHSCSCESMLVNGVLFINSLNPAQLYLHKTELSEPGLFAECTLFKLMGKNIDGLNGISLNQLQIHLALFLFSTKCTLAYSNSCIPVWKQFLLVSFSPMLARTHMIKK